MRRVAELTSTGSFGPPDLDLRPQGPARWGLEFGVQRCRSCGYCSSSLGTVPPGTAEVVESVIYRGVRDGSKLPRLARDYFCAALVAEAAALRDQASSHFLSAAWACDDSGATEQARICRDRAAEMLATAIEWGDVPTESPVVHGVRADMLRRAGRYDDAIDALDSVGAGREDEEDASQAATVLAYIRELAAACDDRPHSVAEAFAAEE